MVWRVVRYFVLLAALVAYVMPFWGNFQGKMWPEFVRNYGGCATRAAWKWRREHIALDWDPFTAHRLTWLALSVILGAVVPLLVMALLRRGPTEVGLGLPNRWGRRVILAGLAIVLPMSFVFAMERLRMPDPGRRAGQAATLRPVELPIAVGVSVPEHLLVTGIAVALLLPGMRLGETSKRQNVKTSKQDDTPDGVSGSASCRGAVVRLREGVLGWLELGQRGDPRDPWWRRSLTWWGLEPAGFWAILGGGFVFGVIHMGARPIEFATSFPGGVLLCYVTYRSGSIWPGWCVHVAQMILVGCVILLSGALRG